MAIDSRGIRTYRRTPWLPERLQATQINHQSWNYYFKSSPGSEWCLFHRHFQALPAQRTGSCACFNGDGYQRGFHPGSRNHRRALWYLLLCINCFRPLQEDGPYRQWLERATSFRLSLPFHNRGCNSHQDP